MLSQAEKAFLIHAASMGIRTDGRAVTELRPVLLNRQDTHLGDASSLCQVGEAQVLCFSRELDVQSTHGSTTEGAEKELEAIHTKIQYIPTQLTPQNTPRLAYCQAIASLLSRSINIPRNIVLNLALLAYGPSYCTAASIAVNECLRQLSSGTEAASVFLVGAWKLGERWVCDATLAEEDSSQASVLALIDSSGQIQHISKYGISAITRAELDTAIEACSAAASVLCAACSESSKQF